jgi:hypothetical protein
VAVLEAELSCKPARSHKRDAGGLDSALTSATCSRMTQRQKQFWMARTPQFAVATLGLVFLATLTFSADARGIHGMGREFGGHGAHGPQFSGDRRRGNDAYTKAASDERDKLLTTKLKSICRGC